MDKPIAMTRIVAAALLGALAAGAAQAGEGPSLRPLLGIGVTVGGDKFVSGIEYDDGYTEDIQAGQFVQFYGGLMYQAVPQFSVQATLGYHVDETRQASNGNAKFARYPLEVLGHIHLDEQFRIGGGARFVNGAKFSSSGFLSSGNVSFESTTGAVVEAEYLVAPQLGLKLRVVSEKYQPKAPFTRTVDGSHVGFMVNFYL